MVRLLLTEKYLRDGMLPDQAKVLFPSKVRMLSNHRFYHDFRPSFSILGTLQSFLVWNSQRSNMCTDQDIGSVTYMMDSCRVRQP
jgi:hypothetical protein